MTLPDPLTLDYEKIIKELDAKNLTGEVHHAFLTTKLAIAIGLKDCKIGDTITKEQGVYARKVIAILRDLCRP